jgi:hypothetical protein
MVEETTEVPVWENTSKNPLCQMYLVQEGNMMLLNRHMVNFEQAMYDYYQKFQGVPLWYVKCSLVPVEALKPTQFKMYNEYVRECKSQQQKVKEELYGVQLDFDVDTSG